MPGIITEIDNQLNILLADDDADDRMFFSDATTGFPQHIQVTTVNDGIQLMQLLSEPETILPAMLFLDLNMPVKNGFQCLSEIRNNDRLKNLFIIIYSTTANPAEIAEAYAGGANLFINKPNSFTGLKHIIEKVLSLDIKEYSSPVKERFILTTSEV